MHTSEQNNEACGIRLCRLLDTQALDIARRETKNDDRMCLYSTGDYWVGFEHSAYFLHHLFPSSELFVLNHPDYPFSIVGVSVPTNKFKKYMKEHIAHRKQEDYLEYPISRPFVRRDYGHWHSERVKSFMEGC